MRHWFLAAVVLTGGGCGSTRGPGAGPGPAADPYVERAMVAGGEAYRDGDLERAAQQFRRALDRARERDRPGPVAEAAYHLAAVQFTAGQNEQALARLAEAEWDAERTGTDAAEIQLLRARVLRAEGRREEASRILAAMLARPRLNAKTRAMGHLLLIDMADETTPATDLADWLNEAAVAASASGDPLLQGRAAVAAVRIHRSSIPPAEAAQETDRAAGYFRRAGAVRELASALALAGDDWAAAGKTDEAVDRWYRAARSRWALDEREAARALLARCRGALDGVEQGTLRAAVEALSGEAGSGDPPGR